MNKRGKEGMDTLLRVVGDSIAARRKWLEGEEEAYMHLLSLSQGVKSYKEFMEIAHSLSVHFYDNDRLVDDDEWDLDISHGRHLFYMNMDEYAKNWGRDCLYIKEEE